LGRLVDEQLAGDNGSIAVAGSRVYVRGFFDNFAMTAQPDPRIRSSPRST